MTPQRIMLLNIVLFLSIAGLSWMIIDVQREVPGQPPIEEFQSTVEKQISAEKEQRTIGDSALKSLGTVALFDDLVPRPTPSPTAVPTPVPPPTPEEVTQYWKLTGALKTIATFQNIKTNQDITLRVGESFTENYRGKDIPVFLESTNQKDWSVTIMIKEGGIVQKRVFKLF